ncbi:MAG TPA: MtnX-like HAD-IB family phosphatase [Tissierellales bacterium]|nr:MtnX-like HAD-IB family phosphatase [Tissierellales bacterium]
MKSKGIAILADFDGTITEIDTNLKLISTFAEEKHEEIRELYNEGKMDLLSSIRLQYKYIKLTEEEYIDFILNEINITEGFVEFYKNIKNKNIPFAIVSGGFENGIKPFLNKYGIYDAEIYANKFIFNDKDMEVKFYDEKQKCKYSKEPCGNCKVKHYENYKKDNEQVIFIGDGWTDRCVAHEADIIFAKEGLLDYCKENNIDCIPWENFNDIAIKLEHLF